jgi:hypothetical protein
MKLIEVGRPRDAGEEALIKEARRRQRRRQFGTGAAVVLTLASALGVVAAVNGNSHAGPGPAVSGTGHRLAPAPAVPGPPRYYATEESWQIVIRKTSTGAVTGRVPNPYATHGSIGFAISVAPVAGNQQFVAAYTGQPPNGRTDQTRLYSFRLTAAGKVTGLSLVKGGMLNNLAAGPAMAASPDGSKVALAVHRQYVLASPRPPAPDEIAVIDLRTGAHGLWQGGLQRPGYVFTIPSISWGSGSRSLVFLSQWCRTSVPGAFCAVGPNSAQAQVRTLGLTAGGGRLSGGRVLLGASARYPYIAQALLSPGGKSITTVVLRPPYLGKTVSIPQDLQVIQVPLAAGEQARLLYHGLMGAHVQLTLRTDPSGRYLLLAGPLNGWIGQGTLHPLKPQGGYAFVDAW